MLIAFASLVPVLFLGASTTTTTSRAQAAEFTLFGTTARPESCGPQPCPNANTLVKVNPNTGEQTFAGSVGFAQHSRAIDWNPTTGTLFGSDIFNNPGVIQEINPGTGVATPVATIRQGGQLVEIGAIAFAPDGTLYGVVGKNALTGLTLGRFDLAPETFVPLLPISTLLFVTGIDISPDGILYAVFANQFPGEFRQTLVAIDLTRLTVIDTKDLGTLNVDDIDFAPDGFIYHTNFSFTLIRINPATGVQTAVGFGRLGPLTGIASVTVQTPQQQATSIIAQVQRLVTAGALMPDQGAGLTDKLNAIIQKLDQGHTRPA